jgi:hypothetical protein
LKRNLKRKTYKRRNIKDITQFPDLLHYGVDEYLGNGSYGFVYILPGYNGRYVLKQHKITNDVNNTNIINNNINLNVPSNSTIPLEVVEVTNIINTLESTIPVIKKKISEKPIKTRKKRKCESWIQEYTMHKQIYNSCNHLLTPLSISIVKPLLFNYGIYNGNTLTKLPNEEGASHCYIIMERVYGRRTDTGIINENIEKKLNKLIKSIDNYKPNHLLPPYLYFGAIETENVITLDLLKGATLHKFPNETLNYCTIGGVAYRFYRNMMASFFIIAGAGFAPRDIEYVLNGNKGKELMTILDFNEVMNWNQRKQKYIKLMERLIITIENGIMVETVDKNYPTYDINIDLAHIYIDLCGLRKTSNQNPMAPYDAPTPQWKFLPNPITCPGGFFQAVEELKRKLPLKKYRFNFDEVIAYILNYIQLHILHPVEECTWKPVGPQFTSAKEYTTFDNLFQIHIVSNLWKLLYKKEQHLENIINMPYSDTIGYLLEVYNGEKKPLIIDEDWGDMSLFSK